MLLLPPGFLASPCVSSLLLSSPHLEGLLCVTWGRLWLWVLSRLPLLNWGCQDQGCRQGWSKNCCAFLQLQLFQSLLCTMKGMGPISETRTYIIFLSSIWNWPALCELPRLGPLLISTLRPVLIFKRYAEQFRLSTQTNYIFISTQTWWI